MLVRLESVCVSYASMIDECTSSRTLTLLLEDADLVDRGDRVVRYHFLVVLFLATARLVTLRLSRAPHHSMAHLRRY